MDGVLVKPVRLDSLRSVLNKLVKIDSGARVEKKVESYNTFFDDQFVRALDATALGETITEWVHDTQSMFADVQRHYDAFEWKMLAQTLHALKGSASQFGAK